MIGHPWLYFMRHQCYNDNMGALFFLHLPIPIFISDHQIRLLIFKDDLGNDHQNRECSREREIATTTITVPVS